MVTNVNSLCACVCAKSLQSCLTLCDPMNCSLRGSSVHGILQARMLEWVAMPSSRVLPNSGIRPTSLASPALAGGFFTTNATWEAHMFYVRAFFLACRDQTKMIRRGKAAKTVSPLTSCSDWNRLTFPFSFGSSRLGQEVWKLFTEEAKALSSEGLQI